MVRYLGGLDPKLSDVVELLPYSALEDHIQLAVKVEKQQKGRRRREYNRPSFRPPPQQVPRPTSQPTRQPTQSLSQGMNQQYPTPPRSPHPTNPIPFNRPPMLCYKCKGLGHKATECPSKKVMGLMEYEPHVGMLEDIMEVDEQEEEEQAQEHPRVRIEADDGDCLVIRRALSGRPKLEEPTQREVIF